MSPSTSPRQPFVLRQMTVEDLPQVMQIDRLSFSLPWPLSAYRYELLENDHSRLWVAEAHPGGAETGRRVVGMVVVWLILDEIHIATLAVHPDWRRQGIAADLLSQALLDGLAQGAVMSTLEVRQSNTPAQALYEWFGFREVHRRKRYYRDNDEDALIMNLSSLDAAYAAWLSGGPGLARRKMQPWQAESPA